MAEIRFVVSDEQKASWDQFVEQYIRAKYAKSKTVANAELRKQRSGASAELLRAILFNGDGVNRFLLMESKQVEHALRLKIKQELESCMREKIRQGENILNALKNKNDRTSSK